MCAPCCATLGSIFEESIVQINVSASLQTLPLLHGTWEVVRRGNPLLRPADFKSQDEADIPQEEPILLPTHQCNSLGDKHSKTIKKRRAIRKDPLMSEIEDLEEAIDKAFRATSNFEDHEALLVKWAEKVEMMQTQTNRYELADRMLESLTSQEPILDQSILRKLWTCRGPLQVEEHKGDFKVVSCNVTTWKTAMFQWVKSHDTIFAVQETHLSEAGAIEMRAHSQKLVCIGLEVKDLMAFWSSRFISIIHKESKDPTILESLQSFYRLSRTFRTGSSLETPMSILRTSAPPTLLKR